MQLALRATITPETHMTSNASYFYEEPSRRCACGAVLFMSPAHDALACLACDKWAEPGCGEEECWAQCSTRPAAPSGVATDQYRSADGDNGGHFLSRMRLRIEASAPPPEPPQVRRAKQKQQPRRRSPVYRFQ